MAPVKATDRQAIIFREGKGNSKGYVLCETVIEQGANGWIFAVRSLSTGKSYVRKRFRPNGRATKEFEIYPRLSHHIAPALIHRTEYKGEGDALIYDFCNGGDLTSFLIKTTGSGPIYEVFVWHLARQLVEILAYIHHGWKDGAAWNEDKDGLWQSIAHGDVQTGNIVLDWPDDEVGTPLPRVLLVDWALAKSLIHFVPDSIGRNSNKDRRLALEADIENAIGALVEINPMRREGIKPEDCPIWNLKRLRAEAEKLREVSEGAEGGFKRFDIATYIAEAFVPLARISIAKEQADERVDYRWTKPKVIDDFDDIALFDVGNPDEELATWSKKHGLRKDIPGKPWDWITLQNIPWANTPPWYVDDNSTSKDRLTFGVEFEISLGCIISKDQKDPDEEDTRAVYGRASVPILAGDTEKPEKERQNRRSARNHVAETLNDHDIKAEVLQNEEDQNTFVRSNPAAWVIKHDKRVTRLAPDKRYDYQGIEITTPALYYSEDAVKYVLYVVTLLSNTYRCAIPTGLHVHVGNGNEGFTTGTIQNLVATYFALEKQIEVIHPASRVDNYMCPSLRRGSKLMGTIIKTLEPRNQIIKGALDYILKPNMRDITKLWNMTASNDLWDDQGEWSNDRPALNSKPIATTAMETVEFRQHAMTLDPVEIAHWISFCVGMLEFSDTVQKADLETFLNNNLNKTLTDYTLVDVLTDIGLPREAAYFAEADSITMHHRTTPSKWKLPII